jgi:tetratricopeptide (TPR) repeat protein
MSLLGALLYNDGKLGEAEPYYREVLAIQRRVLGEDNPQTISQIHGLGLLLMYQHKLAEAEPLLREAAQKMQQLLGDENQNALLAKCNLGYLLEREGRLDEAESIERDAIGKARHALGEDHPVTLVAMILTGMVLEKKGEHAAAEKLLAPIEATVQKTFSGSRAFIAATYLTQLGLARIGLAGYAAAETNLLDAHAIFEQTHNVTHVDDLRDCTQALVALYTAWDKAEPGKGRDASAAEWKKKLDEVKVAPPRG